MPIQGVRDTYKKVMSANGPAQMLTYAFWGVLMAGMFQGVCDMCFPPELLIFWGAISAMVVPITIWGSKAWLRNILLIDVVVSAYIMTVFLTHEPHATGFVYYTPSINGMDEAVRGMSHSLSDWFHAAALVWMTLHAVYLADLTNRQILERKRFSQYDT
jgi:hypothetical protein